MGYYRFYPFYTSVRKLPEIKAFINGKCKSERDRVDLYNIYSTVEELDKMEIPVTDRLTLAYDIYKKWWPDRWDIYFQWKRMRPGFSYLNSPIITTQHLKEQLARGFVLRSEFKVDNKEDYYIKSLIADLVYPKKWNNQTDAIKKVNQIGVPGCTGIFSPKS